MWPTPNAEGGTGYMSGSNRDTWRPTLAGAVQMAPTGPPPQITADEFRGKGRGAAKRQWPNTPSASLGPNGGLVTPAKAREGGTLIEAVSARMWPTPTASDGMGGPGSSGRDGGDNLRTAVNGALNPTWVEILMGFPPGWTDLDA